MKPAGGIQASRLLVIPLASLCVVLPGRASAQDDEIPLRRLWVEGAVGAAVPTQAFGNVDPTCPDNNAVPCPFPSQIGATTGVGFAGRVGARFDHKTAVFVGYSRNQFQCSDFFCGGAESPLSSSIDLGVQRGLFAFGDMRFWGEGAVSWERVNVVRVDAGANLALNERVPYDRAVAFSFGLGIRLGLRGANEWEFTPAARYRFYSAEPNASNRDLNALDVTHFHLDLAFRRNFF